MSESITVGQLIKILSKHDPESEVRITSAECSLIALPILEKNVIAASFFKKDAMDQTNIVLLS